MATQNQDFLKFSAYSIKDLITRKLSESTKFTDQVYEGSNLAILIDIFSYMAQCVLYSLNTAAGESMFSDTQLYENMNRLVKFLGYNPKGVQAASVTLTLDQSGIHEIFGNTTVFNLYKYSAIDVGKSDSRGNKVYYSLVDTVTTTTEKEFSTLFYNGRWNKYLTSLYSDGSEYQTFILLGIGSKTTESDDSLNRYVVDGMIHVYVEDSDGNIEQYRCVQEGLFTDNNINNGSYIYKSTEPIFNLRLNEDKIYEITFGNGFTGKIPPKNAQIHVFYLECNGSDGELLPYEVQSLNLIHNSNFFGISQELYSKIFNINKNVDEDEENPIYSPTAVWTNTAASSVFRNEEDVYEIRRNAPEWFKTGNRLVTASDFEYFVRNRFRDNVVDVKCQNNWQYASTFYQWLYNLGLNGKRIKFGQRPALTDYYLNQNRLQKYDLKYADSADGNNVYLWIKMRNDSNIYKNLIDEELLNIKSLTQEPVYMSPLNLNFSFCAADVDTAVKYILDDAIFDVNHESYLEVTLDDNTLYSNNDIKTEVEDIILKFFDEKNFTLGQTINFSDLANQILNLHSVTRIRTVYRNDEGESRIINGLSFATWTTDIIDSGDDMEVSSISRTLEVFQFPVLYRKADLASKIKVIRKSISSVNSIQY